MGRRENAPLESCPPPPRVPAARVFMERLFEARMKRVTGGISRASARSQSSSVKLAQPSPVPVPVAHQVQAIQHDIASFNGHAQYFAHQAPMLTHNTYLGPSWDAGSQNLPFNYPDVYYRPPPHPAYPFNPTPAPFQYPPSYLHTVPYHLNTAPPTTSQSNVIFNPMAFDRQYAGQAPASRETYHTGPGYGPLDTRI